MAAENGDEMVGRPLLEKGVDDNTKDGDGNTPLHSAAPSGHEVVVRPLLEK